ncbi:phosphopantetheine-binding protein, partial [Actinosynnema sp. NPDC023658]|uniref:phosphopantetheine-binding protein n=1 Tax=Actinosynnema sp. NPDC023658 TaxID=3155465 RepID=UPI0033CDC735
MGDATTEGRLRELWQHLLAVADIHDDSNFFTLGGHSMLATRLMSRARRTLGVDLPARLIFDRPVFGPFVAGVEAVLAGGADTDRPVVVITGAATGPLSLQQEQLMLVESVLGPSPANHTAVAVELGTTPDIPVLRRAVELLRTRHDALRTRFAATASGHTQSTVPADALPPLVFEEHDLRSAPANKVEVRARRIVRGLFLTPFDLAGGETLRAQLFH